MNKMKKSVKKEFYINNDLISIETGKIARQCSGSVLIKAKKTTVLCTVVVSRRPQKDCDFLPLTVNYLQKQYAAGKIPGGYIKREGKPSDGSILISRLIDRSIRPTIADNFHNEINITCTVLSFDPEYSPDILSIIGSSAALAISEVPTKSIISGVRVAMISDSLKLNPSESQLRECALDLVISASKSSITMVESESKELEEEKIMEAIEFGKRYIFEINEKIEELQREIGKKKFSSSQEKTLSQSQSDILNEARQRMDELISHSFIGCSKIERVRKISDMRDELENFLIENGSFDPAIAKSSIVSIVKKSIRSKVLNSNLRIDGRRPDELREIEIDVDLLPQVHGSALFTRGETQALVITTLGICNKDKQIVDGLGSKQTEESFMLHYNFPPYSVGEVGQLKSPGRREIGHGKLAWKALNPLLPSNELFNYVIRVVSEITESDGSSSMATVCGASLSLMDCGVPIKSPVAGIAMGLVIENETYVILSDIMGEEDNIGDMDFKVAGTKHGITALQMDIKVDGISADIIYNALKKAKVGRMHILNKMNEAIPAPRSELGRNVPKIEIVKIPIKKIKDLIGSRGAVIKEICTSSGASVDVDDLGNVKVSSSNPDALKKAVSMVRDVTFDPEIGDIFEGPVVKVIDAGAFVSISPNRDGFVHVSELANYRVDFVEDIINEGDIVKTKVIGFDKKGRPKLSYRSVDQLTGEDISDNLSADRTNDK